MFGKKKKQQPETTVDSVAEATTQARAAAIVEIRMGNPPRRLPATDQGIQDARAEQDARNLLAAHAIDAVTVAASTILFPSQESIDAKAQVAIATIVGERAEAEIAGDSLIARAEQGEFVPPSPHAPNPSAVGVAATLQQATDALADAKAQHEQSVQVLAGERLDSDGSKRPGSRIAPDSERPRRDLRWHEAIPLLRLGLLILVEGVVITGNQIAYLRLPASEAWHGVAIAIVAVLLLTYAPHFAGRVLGPAVHGAPITKAQLIGPIALGVVWLAAAIAAAIVRVDVDRASAVAAAEDERARAVKQLLTMDPDADPSTIPLVDPGAVFDPALPLAMWLAFLVGMGLLFAALEAYDNHVRLDELRHRIGVIERTEKTIALEAQADAIAKSVELQRGAKTAVLAMWDAQGDVILAGAEQSKRIFEQALAEASGDPEMILALERHRAEIERRREAAAAEGGER